MPSLEFFNESNSGRPPVAFLDDTLRDEKHPGLAAIAPSSGLLRISAHRAGGGAGVPQARLSWS